MVVVLMERSIRLDGSSGAEGKREFIKRVCVGKEFVRCKKPEEVTVSAQRCAVAQLVDDSAITVSPRRSHGITSPTNPIWKRVEEKIVILVASDRTHGRNFLASQNRAAISFCLDFLTPKPSQAKSAPTVYRRPVRPISSPTSVLLLPGQSRNFRRAVHH